MALDAPVDFEAVLPPPRARSWRRVGVTLGIVLFLGAIGYGVWFLAPPAIPVIRLPPGWSPDCPEVVPAWQILAEAEAIPESGAFSINGRWFQAGPCLLYAQTYVASPIPNEDGGWQVLLPLGESRVLATSLVRGELLAAATLVEGRFVVISVDASGLVLTELDPVALAMLARHSIQSPVLPRKANQRGGYHDWVLFPLAEGRLGVIGSDREAGSVRRYLVVNPTTRRTEFEAVLPRLRRPIPTVDGEILLEELVSWVPSDWDYAQLELETGKTTAAPEEWTFPPSRYAHPAAQSRGVASMPLLATGGRSHVDLQLATQYIWPQIEPQNLHQVARGARWRYHASNLRWKLWSRLLGRDETALLSDKAWLLPIRIADARDPAAPVRRLEGDFEETLRASMATRDRGRVDWIASLTRFYRLNASRVLVAQLIPARARADGGPSLLRLGTLAPESDAVAWQAALRLPVVDGAQVESLEALKIVPDGPVWYLGLTARAAYEEASAPATFFVAWAPITAPVSIQSEVAGGLLEISSHR